MKVTAILSLAVGATASFTQVVRKSEPGGPVIGSINFYKGTKCSASEEPFDTSYVVNNLCYAYERHDFGSLSFIPDNGLNASCIGIVYEGAGCGGNWLWNSVSENCADELLDRTNLSFSVSCSPTN